MKSSRRHADACRKLMQFLDTIRHEVEPRGPVLQNFGIVDVHHLLFSPVGGIYHSPVYVPVRAFPGRWRIAPASATGTCG